MSNCRLMDRPGTNGAWVTDWGWETLPLSFSPISSPSAGDLPFLNDAKFQVMLISLHQLIHKNEGTGDPLSFCGIRLGSSGKPLQNYCKSQTLRLPCISHGCVLMVSSDQPCAFAASSNCACLFSKGCSSLRIYAGPQMIQQCFDDADTWNTSQLST